MYKILLSALLILLPYTSFSQEVKGKIVDNSDSPLSLVNVVLLSGKDSTFIKGVVSGDDGSFAIDTCCVDGIVRVSLLGYETLYKKCGNGDLGIIKMSEGAKSLAEVVVKGHRSLYKMDSDGLTSKIQDTPLSKLGSLTDVLGQLPFLNVDGSNVTVLGRGKPLIYINNKLVTDDIEMKNIKSSEVKDVKIITNPDSRYPSGVASVIRITTIRTKGHGLSGMAQWDGVQRKKFSQSDYLSLNYRLNGWDFFGSVYYRENKSRQNQTNDMSFSYNNTPINTHNESRQTEKFQAVLSSVGTNYVSEDESLYAGAQYYYSRTIKTPFDQNSVYTATDASGNHDFLTHFYQNNHGGSHNANAYLFKEFKNKWTLDYNMSYVKLNISTDLSTVETEASKESSVNSTTSRSSKMWAEKLIMTKNAKIGTLFFGEEFSFTDNKQAYDLTSQGVNTGLSSNDNRALQRSLGIFAGYKKSWKQFNLSTGLRYEIVSFDYYLNGKRQEEMCKEYNNLMPSLSLNYSNGAFGATLSFRSTVGRPSYQQLRSSMSYSNSYSYEGGNPALQTTYTHDLGLTLIYKDFVLSSDFIYYKDAIMFYNYTLSNAPIKVSSFTNNDYKMFNVMGTYSRTFGIWSPSVTLSGAFQSLKYGGVDYNKPIFSYSFKNVFTLPSSFYLTINMRGSSAGESQFIYSKASFTTSAAISKYFGKLYAKIGVQDIFNSSKEAWNVNTNGISNSKWCKGDSRYVYLTLQYSFNAVRSKYKGTGAGNDEKERL